MASPSPISTSLDLLVRLAGACPSLWQVLGNMESRLLAPSLPDIKSPIYVCGLARSGSTLLLEILAAHEEVATHRYRDFPFIMIPYVWNAVITLNPLRDTSLRERTHGDGMQITPDSPEAMEEMLWMAFFPHCHDEAHTQVMGAESVHPAFEHFYRQHIQKLLLARKAQRYAAKGNYNITRMAYLASLHKDARFLIPVRHPASHIASLKRQHERFCAFAKDDPRVVAHMNHSGHFEFGPNRRIINTGDTARIHEIKQAWNSGEEVRGLAIYWDMIYRFLHEQCAKPELRERAITVRLEDMAAQPDARISRVFSHCQLAPDTGIARRFAAAMKPVDNTGGLTPRELQLIQDITGETARLYGYD